jgi:RNA polymerase sigma-70 factor (ECF subfamily)
VIDQNRDGRAQRFQDQILPHLTSLYRTALRLVRTPADAEDLVQETCLRAFRALDQLKDPDAAKTWVFAVLRSVSLRHFEREAGSIIVPVALSDVLPHPQAPSFTDVAADSPLQRALIEEVRAATLRLPRPYREAIVLAHIAGFSYREMSQILEIPVGTVMSRLFRARRLLRDALADTPPAPSKLVS